MNRTLLCVFLLCLLVRAAVAASPVPRNPFGVIVGSGALMMGGDGMSLQTRIAVAKDLGAACFRPADIKITEWNGGDKDAEAIRKAGFKVVLTVRNGGQDGSPPIPATPPLDMAKYKKTIGSVLAAYKPELLVVENEESSEPYYSGTPQQYGAELKAACAVAHSKGVKCANGGLSSGMVMAMVWDNYMQKRQKAKADDFARRTCSPEECQMLSAPGGRQSVAEFIARGKALLKVYKPAGIDYVNFHWSIPDPKALQEAVAYLKSATGLQPITNEIGLRDMESQPVQTLMAEVVKLKLPYAIWYSVDRIESLGLQNPDGMLRPNGAAFKAFVKERFGR